MDNNKKLSASQIIFTILYLPFWPAFFLFLSGDWHWTEGWIFAIWFFVTCASVLIYLFFKDPALLAERFRQPGTGNQKSWDKLVFLLIVLGWMSWIVIIPLDSKRFEWTSRFPTMLKYLGGLMLPFSTFFFYRAFTDNTFLSPVVRLQEERKHQLITTGIYGFVRHPMYLGALLFFIGVPLLTGSYFGLAAACFMILVLGVRAIGEEKMLTEKFEEYKDYKQKVRYRFFPLIW